MTVESKHGAEILKQTQAMAEMVKDMMPKVTTSKNGYEIRAKILQVAKDHEQFEYQAKVAGVTTRIDPDTNEIVTTVEMPKVPTVDDILVTNGVISSFTATSGSIYTAILTPLSDGNIRVYVPMNVFTDVVGNSNTTSDQFNWTYDGTPPNMTISVTNGINPLSDGAVTADTSLTANDSGETFVFNDADGAVLTLPDSGDGSLTGVYFNFFIAVTATSNAHKVVCTDTTNEKLYGQVLTVDTDTSDANASFAAQAGDSFSAISSNGGTTGIIGSNYTI